MKTLSRMSWLMLFVLVASIALTACEKEVEVTRVVTQQETIVEKETIVETVVEMETVVETVVEMETVVETVVVQATEEPRGPVIFRVGQTDIMDTINPHSFWYGWTIRWLWYETPVAQLEGGGWTPGLAESWEVSDDGLVWTFKIREGLTFHDGSPLDAEAIAWSMNYMYQVENYSVGYLWHFDWTGVRSIEAPDPTTLQITSEWPISNMEYILFYAYILPRSVWEGMETAEDAKAFDDVAACTGAGPFKCVESVPEEYLILEAFEDYWRGKPTIDQLIIQQYASEDALVEALLAGEVDAIYGPGTAVETLRADPNVEVVIGEGIEWDMLAFNVVEPCEEGQESSDYEPCGSQTESITDPIIREAIDYAIDRDRIIAIGYAGFAEPAGSIIPPGHGEYKNPYVAPTPLDLEHANGLLDEAGYLDSDGDEVREWSDGSPLEYNLMTSDTPLYARLAELIQEDLAAIGISVVIELLPDTSVRRAPVWDYDLWYFSYGSDIDPDFPLISVLCGERYPGGWNWTGSCTDEGDAYYWAQQAAVDPDDRVKVVHEAQEFIYNERPWAMIAYTNTITAYRKDRFTGLGSRTGYADFMYPTNLLKAAPVP
jgi:peptide/nickel transport system substrate-binding protein